MKTSVPKLQWHHRIQTKANFFSCSNNNWQKLTHKKSNKFLSPECGKFIQQNPNEKKNLFWMPNVSLIAMQMLDYYLDLTLLATFWLDLKSFLISYVIKNFLGIVWTGISKWWIMQSSNQNEIIFRVWIDLKIALDGTWILSDTCFNFRFHSKTRNYSSFW